MLGIVIGVGAVITMVAVGSGAQARVAEQIQSLGSNMIIVLSGLRERGATSIQGVTPEFFSAREWDVADGRLFTQKEVDGAAKVALIGPTVAGNLFGDSDPLNQVIRIRNVPFCVIGVLERKGQSTYGQDQDDTVLIPLSTAKKKVIGSS